MGRFQDRLGWVTQEEEEEEDQEEVSGSEGPT